MKMKILDVMLNFFPSYTRMIEVNLNGNIYKAIFQEDAFLERNNLDFLKSNDFNFYLNEKEYIKIILFIFCKTIIQKFYCIKAEKHF